MRPHVVLRNIKSLLTTSLALLIDITIDSCGTKCFTASASKLSESALKEARLAEPSMCDLCRAKYHLCNGLNFFDKFFNNELKHLMDSRRVTTIRNFMQESGDDQA